MKPRQPTAKLSLVAETKTPSGVRRRLGQALRELMRAKNLSAEVCLVLADDKQLQALKLKHWGEDQPTDVLSFPQWEPGDPFIPAHLGDIIISVETAQRQALERGHDLLTEVAILASHGLCHLLGHDHQSPDEWAPFNQAEMEIKQILRGLEIAQGAR